jgi:hypothetical protein
LITQFNLKLTNIVKMTSNVIRYICSGCLGDFIHTLSIVNQLYLTTGKKGIVYLSEHREKFHYGLQTTYEDIKNIVLSQNYIQSFEIYTNQNYDIDLSIWRNYLSSTTWYHIFSSVYGVSWGETKWLTLPTDDRFKDCILIGHSNRRKNCSLNYTNFLNSDRKKVFVTTDPKEWEEFKSLIKFQCEVEIFSSLNELWSAIQSCFLFIGNLSSPLAIAYACHTPTIAILTCGPYDDEHFMGLEKISDRYQWYRSKYQFTKKVKEYFNI